MQEVRLLIALVAAIAALACESAREPAQAPGVSVLPSRPPPEHTYVYIVQSGDSLSGIAACSGLSVEALARMNRIADPDRLQTGARLRLPAEHPCTAPQRSPAVRSPKRQPEPARSARVQAERSLAAAKARYDAADFDHALAEAENCVQRLAPHTLDAKAKRLGARCHVIAAMAAAGLDRRDRAIEELRQAFALDPDLELPPETTSPRILELVSAAQPRP